MGVCRIRAKPCRLRFWDLTAGQLKSSNWFKGPAFLWESNIPDEDAKAGEIKENDPELRKAFVCTTNAKRERTILNRFEKFSEWSRLIRALAILRRKVKECKDLLRTKESTSLEEWKLRLICASGGEAAWLKVQQSCHNVIGMCTKQGARTGQKHTVWRASLKIRP